MSRLTRSVGAVVVRNGTCLAARRGPQMSFSHQWEFPGGKIKHGESPEQALVREIREELNIDIEIVRFLGRGYGSAGPGDVVIDVYAAKHVGGELALEEHGDCGWFGPHELERLDWVEPASDLLIQVKSFLRLRKAEQDRDSDLQVQAVRLWVKAASFPATLALAWMSTCCSVLSAQMALLARFSRP